MDLKMTPIGKAPTFYEYDQRPYESSVVGGLSMENFFMSMAGDLITTIRVVSTSKIEYVLDLKARSNLMRVMNDPLQIKTILLLYIISVNFQSNLFG